jgi:hypothetical protein
MRLVDGEERDRNIAHHLPEAGRRQPLRRDIEDVQRATPQLAAHGRRFIPADRRV